MRRTGVEDDGTENVGAPARARRFRLLPITVTMLALLFVVKLNEVYLGSRALRELYGVRSAVASDKKPEEKSEEKSSEKAEAAKAGDTEKAAPAVGEVAESADHATAEEGGHGGGHGGGKPAEEPKTYGTGKSTIKEIEALKAKESAPRYSQNEMDLLGNLAKRREDLDTREKDLELKSKVLEATQKRIDDKLAEMKALEVQLNKILASYNEKQDAQIASLVKIYEAMKPLQAAAIFNELDLPILLEVIDKMSERKVAPVLALMDPRKARDVTQELAAMRKSAPKLPASQGAR